MSNRINIVRNTSKALEVNLVDDDGEPISLDDLVNATAVFTVRVKPDDVSNILQFTTVGTPSRLAFKPGEPALLLTFVSGDTASLDIKSYAYQIEVTKADGSVQPVIQWSPFDVNLGGSAEVPPPPFDNTTKIDHNYQLPDDLTFLTPGGSPIVGAQIRLYVKADYDAGRLNTPVGTTTTDAAGHWTNPILVAPGYSYIVRFEKPYEWSPVTREIFA